MMACLNVLPLLAYGFHGYQYPLLSGIKFAIKGTPTLSCRPAQTLAWTVPRRKVSMQHSCSPNAGM